MESQPRTREARAGIQERSRSLRRRRSVGKEGREETADDAQAVCVVRQGSLPCRAEATSAGRLRTDGGSIGRAVEEDGQGRERTVHTPGSRRMGETSCSVVRRTSQAETKPLRQLRQGGRAFPSTNETHRYAPLRTSWLTWLRLSSRPLGRLPFVRSSKFAMHSLLFLRSSTGGDASLEADPSRGQFCGSQSHVRATVAYVDATSA